MRGVFAVHYTTSFIWAPAKSNRRGINIDIHRGLQYSITIYFIFERGTHSLRPTAQIFASDVHHNSNFSRRPDIVDGPGSEALCFHTLTFIGTVG